MPMKYRLIIFDFDGTLADTFGLLLSLTNRLAIRHGYRSIAEEDLERLRACTVRQFMDYLGVSMWKMPRIARDMRLEVAAAITTVRLFPGIEEMLDALDAAGVSLAVVTSNAEGNVRHVLGEQRSALIMHYECGAGLLGKRSRILRAVRRCGVTNDQALYVGDEIRDHDAARAAGVAFGAVSWGFAAPSALEALAPDHIFSSPAQISRLAETRADGFA
jgi:phosphoglycolate phosphatase